MPYKFLHMAVAKQVQWQWSGTHDNPNCVILQGALHIEMVSMNIIGGCTTMALLFDLE